MEESHQTSPGPLAFQGGNQLASNEPPNSPQNFSVKLKQPPILSLNKKFSTSCRAQPAHSLATAQRQSAIILLNQLPKPSAVPSESIEESTEFFNQITIKNIIHINHKINEIKNFSSNNNYDVRHLSLSVAESNEILCFLDLKETS